MMAKRTARRTMPCSALQILNVRGKSLGVFIEGHGGRWDGRQRAFIKAVSQTEKVTFSNTLQQLHYGSRDSFFPNVIGTRERADAIVKTDEMQYHCSCSLPETGKGQQAWRPTHDRKKTVFTFKACRLGKTKRFIKKHKDSDVFPKHWNYNSMT